MPLVKAIEKHEEVIEAQHEDGKNAVKNHGIMKGVVEIQEVMV